MVKTEFLEEGYLLCNWNNLSFKEQIWKIVSGDLPVTTVDIKYLPELVEKHFTGKPRAEDGIEIEISSNYDK